MGYRNEKSATDPALVLILEILKCGGSSPPCPKNVGAWSIKMGTYTSAKEGLNSEPFICRSICLFATAQLPKFVAYPSRSPALKTGKDLSGSVLGYRKQAISERALCQLTVF